MVSDRAIKIICSMITFLSGIICLTIIGIFAIDHGLDSGLLTAIAGSIGAVLGYAIKGVMKK